MGTNAHSLLPRMAVASRPGSGSDSETISAQIIGGHSRSKLHNQLGDIGRYSCPDRVAFLLQLAPRKGKAHDVPHVYVYVNSMTALDESGENWQISGYIKGNLVPFSAIYNTRRQMGRFSCPEGGLGTLPVQIG